MPTGNRAFLLAALLFLWVLGVGYLMAWYIAFSGFDGYDANIPLALALYGLGGLGVVALLYFGIGALLHDDESGGA